MPGPAIPVSGRRVVFPDFVNNGLTIADTLNGTFSAGQTILTLTNGGVLIGGCGRRTSDGYISIEIGTTGETVAFCEDGNSNSSISFGDLQRIWWPAGTKVKQTSGGSEQVDLVYIDDTLPTIQKFFDWGIIEAPNQTGWSGYRNTTGAADVVMFEHGANPNGFDCYAWCPWVLASYSAGLAIDDNTNTLVVRIDPVTGTSSSPQPYRAGWLQVFHVPADHGLWMSGYGAVVGRHL